MRKKYYSINLKLICKVFFALKNTKLFFNKNKYILKTFKKYLKNTLQIIKSLYNVNHRICDNVLNLKKERILCTI